MRPLARTFFLLGASALVAGPLACGTAGSSNSSAAGNSNLAAADTEPSGEVAKVAETRGSDVTTLPDIGPVLDTAAPLDVPSAPVTCPPVAPFGTKQGVSLQDVKLKACDGKDVALHDLCGAKAGLFYLFAGW